MNLTWILKEAWFNVVVVAVIVVLSPEKVVFKVLSLFYLYKLFIFKLFYIVG